jgi:uncharacterized protein YdeI (YjbR/CyaY-like superfamily)
MDPIFFKNPAEFREWLEKNHLSATEMWVGYYKKETGKPSMTWSESVDQAICFGWIDGIRQSVDKDSYCIRFTPRKKTSKWSAINIAKVEELTQQGLMRPAGLEAFKYCKESNSRVYSFESRGKELPEEFEKEFKANPVAWAFYTAQPPSYKKMVIHWLLSAKQEETRLAHLKKLISESEKQVRLYGQNKNAKR